MKISQMPSVSSLNDTDVAPIVRSGANYKVTMQTIRNHVSGPDQLAEDIINATPINTNESLEYTDKMVVVRGGVAFKVALQNICKLVREKFYAMINNMTELLAASVGDGDSIPISHGDASRRISVSNLSTYIMNRRVRTGSVSTSGFTGGHINYDNGNGATIFSSAPFVICSPRQAPRDDQGNDITDRFWEVRPYNVTGAGFDFTIIRQMGGETSSSGAPFTFTWLAVGTPSS